MLKTQQPEHIHRVLSSKVYDQANAEMWVCGKLIAMHDCQHMLSKLEQYTRHDLLYMHDAVRMI